ncbi:unnamed protein product [Diplocarpon coronariae]|uniref:Uncharacterized protein n=1 Tax=Diplocarpon coronariae TaxID=2795749 RepID=A0A218ZEY3_9HELO|nr:hypothetical protein B2J93_1765 [Marssonina coronariae]
MATAAPSRRRRPARGVLEAGYPLWPRDHQLDFRQVKGHASTRTRTQHPASSIQNPASRIQHPAGGQRFGSSSKAPRRWMRSPSAQQLGSTPSTSLSIALVSLTSARPSPAPRHRISRSSPAPYLGHPTPDTQPKHPAPSSQHPSPRRPPSPADTPADTMSTNFLTAIYHYKFLVFVTLFLLGSAGLGQLIRRYNLSWSEIYLAQLVLSLQWLLVANMQAPPCDSCAREHGALELDVERLAAADQGAAGEKSRLRQYYQVGTPEARPHGAVSPIDAPASGSDDGATAPGARAQSIPFQDSEETEGEPLPHA